MASFTEINLLAKLTAGNEVEWYQQTTTLGPPASAAAGRTTSGTVTAQYHVPIRENAAHRTAHAVISAVVAGETYTITIAGSAVSYVALALDDEAAIVAGLIAALPGVPAADALVTFAAEDVAAVGDGLVIAGKAEAGYSIGANATGAAGIDVEADAEHASLTVWILPGGTAGTGQALPTVWTVAGTDGRKDLDYRGEIQRINVAGLSRVYLQVSDLDGPQAPDAPPFDTGSVTYRQPVGSLALAVD
jgi:hypothetical protein